MIYACVLVVFGAACTSYVFGAGCVCEERDALGNHAGKNRVIWAGLFASVISWSAMFLAGYLAGGAK